MDILTAQIITLIGLFASMFLAFIFPSCLVNKHPKTFENPKCRLALSLANCVSGGVFVATFFIGLLPEVREMFNEILKKAKIGTNFPITEFVVFLGFCLALVIEQGVLEYQEKSVDKGTEDTQSSETLDSEKRNDSGAKDANKSKKEENKENSDSDSHHESISLLQNVPKTKLKVISQSHGHGPRHHGHNHSDVGDLLKNESGLRMVMLLLSLGIHSLFEGIALGLQTDMATLINLFVGVAVHEILMSFAMGISVSSLNLSIPIMTKFAVLFSAMIPFGQGIGLLLGTIQSQKSQTASAILQGLAAGTFVHVTFFEAIPSELREQGYRLLKVLFICLGFGLLLGCTFLLGNNPGHSHN